MTSALIGCTGFVGGQLARDQHFDCLVHRPTLESLVDRHFTRIVCAGLPAAKWIANKDPQQDLANVERLEAVLRTISAEQFVLISTIDVYPRIVEADEDFDCDSLPNHAYGSHRRRFEAFVRANFPAAQIVRLPALFGQGLKKNVIFDLLHGNQLERINPESRFQWYPLARLHADLRLIERHDLPLVNLFAEPLVTGRIAKKLFPDRTIGAAADTAAHYDLATKHGKIFGGDGRYVMSASAVLDELAVFVAGERCR